MIVKRPRVLLAGDRINVDGRIGTITAVTALPDEKWEMAYRTDDGSDLKSVLAITDEVLLHFD